MIEARNLNKSFGEKQVLTNINVKFEAGKNNLIIGQSGSGKTVLMKSMVGLLVPDSGEILFNDRDFLAMNRIQQNLIRQEVGMVFQGGALFDSLNVLENVIFPLNMFTQMPREEKIARANFCLQRVGLENVNKLFPSEISGGMKKRVAIARAISNNPKYLFCDEPNSGLDPQTSARIDGLIDEITNEYKITTIVNTHDMNSVLQIGDNITFISKGTIGWKGSKNEILQTDTAEIREFMNASELTRRLIKN